MKLIKINILCIICLMVFPNIIKALSVEETIDKATECMVRIANDDSHGYNSQIGHRWGEQGDYSCSTLNETCWVEAGVNVKQADNDSANHYMVNRYLKLGFVDITDKVNINSGEGLEKGDVLFIVGTHVAQYVGDGKIVEATANEFGGSGGTGGGGQPGDQNHGAEISVNNYRGGWNKILRYNGTEDSEGGGLTVDVTQYINPLQTEDVTCETIFVNYDGSDKEFKKILKSAFFLIEIMAPIITIVLTTIDYIKAIGDPTKIKKCNKRAIIRLVITIIIVFIPFILNLLFSLFGLYDLRNCLLN